MIWDQVIAVATILVFAATFWMACSTWTLAKAQLKQSTDLAQQIRADEISNRPFIAVRSLRLFIDTSDSIKRLPKPLRRGLVRDNVSIDKQSVFARVRWQNSGRSVGVITHRHVSVSITQPLAISPFAPFKKAGFNRAVGVTQLTASTTYRLDFPLTDAVLMELRNGDRPIYVQGRIRYLDLFGSEYENHFCAKFSSLTKAARPAEGQNLNFTVWRRTVQKILQEIPPTSS